MPSAVIRPRPRKKGPLDGGRQERPRGRSDVLDAASHCSGQGITCHGHVMARHEIEARSPRLMTSSDGSSNGPSLLCKNAKMEMGKQKYTGNDGLRRRERERERARLRQQPHCGATMEHRDGEQGGSLGSSKCHRITSSGEQPQSIDRFGREVFRTCRDSLLTCENRRMPQESKPVPGRITLAAA